MNDQAEILKRQFWNSIKPEEPREEKRLKDCAIYISSTNLNPPADREMTGWTFLGSADELLINIYKQNECLEFKFERANDFMEELLIFKHFAMLIVCRNVLAAKKLHLFNNNNEFYLLNNKFYFKGFSLKVDPSNSFYPLTSKSMFIMTYFASYD